MFFDGYGYHGTSFEQTYRCYPASFIDKPQLENGDKIIMPPSALDRLASLHIDYPMLFELRNAATERVSHCGVLEFIAEEGMIYMPYWMMENLLLQEGDIVRVKNVTLPKGTYVKLQPHTKDFLDISNPKAILETTLRNFSCLTTGDSIMVAYNNKKYYIDIVETKPSNAISIIETDCEVDFAPPLDYKEPEKPTISPISSKAPAGVLDEESNNSESASRAQASTPTISTPRRSTSHASKGPSFATLPSSKDLAIELDDDDKDQATILASIKDNIGAISSTHVSRKTRQQPLTVSSLRETTPDVPLTAETSINSLRETTPDVPLTTETSISSPSFSALRERLSAIKATVQAPLIKADNVVTAMDVPTAVASLASLMTQQPDEVFKHQVNELVCALNCVLSHMNISASLRNSLQFFLANLEGNRAAFTSHKPIVDAYRHLQADMDVCSSKVLILSDEIDTFEAESAQLTAEESNLKARLAAISTRQDEIVTKLADLSLRVQTTVVQYEENSNFISKSKDAHDFSLPVVNAAIMSWEGLKTTLLQLPDFQNDTSTSAIVDPPVNIDVVAPPEAPTLMPSSGHNAT